MSTHNICFYGELTKIILQLSSNTLFICSNVTILNAMLLLHIIYGQAYNLLGQFCVIFSLHLYSFSTEKMTLRLSQINFEVFKLDSCDMKLCLSLTLSNFLTFWSISIFLDI